jgi:hypothetical protein
MKLETKTMKNSILRFTTGQVLLIAGLYIITIQLTAQTNSDENFSQYMFPGFTKGLVRMKTGESFNAVLNYNTVTENMVWEKDGKLLDLANMESVDTIFLQNRKFIPVDKVFYEVLVNAPISMFIQHKNDLVQAGSPAGYGSTSQTSSIKNFSSIALNSRTYNLALPPDYTLNQSTVYWIKKSNTMFSFLNKRQFLKIFPGEKDEIEKFINQNRLKFENRDDLIKLVNYCNDVIR